ncbi:PREDICTED: nephrin [Nanorana parkeri]|uniref:nephrin n=1 Tax=Nanorana parkeri TaxID=125878 RepID=UPI0008545971|nr:PREDICTED: nephrin [Nanorana parkeri]
MASILVILICCFGPFQGVSATQQAFRIQPDNGTAVQGSTHVFICEVEHPSGTVQWVKDGLLLGPDRRIPGFPRYSMTGDPKKGEYNLRIERCDLSDDGQYHCQVGRSEVSLGIVSITALLNVLIPPEVPVFKDHLAGSTVTWVYGEEYPVTCSIKNAKPAAVLTLTKSGVEVTVESSNSPGSQEKLENSEITAQIIAQSTDNRKLLVCSASNAALQMPLIVSFTMNVLFPPDTPTIDGYEGPTIKADETLKLTCTSMSGNPLATLQWLKNEEVVNTRWETDSKKGLSRSHLTLNIKAEHNLAVISCEAVNHVTPMVLRTSITLNVVFLPTKVTILGPTSGAENKSLSLSCFTATSNPPVSIRWWLGPVELGDTVVTITDSDHGGKVTMSNITTVVQREHNGMQLTCEAFNEAILYSKANSVQLSVQYPPQKIWLEAPPLDIRFRAGTRVRLTCFSSGGHPAPRLIWLKDKKALTEGKQIVAGKIVSREINLETVPSDNQATYRCNATNDGKPALSATTKIHVQFPPLDVKIINEPKAFQRGTNITLECRSGSSNPESKITWVKQGVILKAMDLGVKNAEYGGKSTSSRVMLSLSSADNGKRVACEAYSNVLKEGVNTFYKLNVLFPPEFTDDQPKVVQAVEHGAALIPGHIRANPAEVTYTWTRHGETLNREGAYRHHLRGAGALEIWNVSRADSGDYTVTCENAQGTNSTMVTLDVHYSPTIRSLGDPTEVDLGGRAEIVCTADANPATDGMFQWRWLGDEDRDLSGLERKVDGLTGRLIITEAKRSDAGRYECTVENGVPPAVKADARLIVRFKPEIQKGVHLSKVAVAGDGKTSTGLLCKAEGIPSVSFSWAKNGVTLDFKNPRYSVQMSHEHWVHTSTLIIANVSAVHDYAIFTCTATNALGLDIFSIHLVSTSRPDPPSDLKVLSFTHNSITLGWSAGFDGGLEQRFRVRYRWSGVDSHMYVDVFPPQSTVFTISGLKGSTAYNFSVNAINVLGDSDYADGNAIITVTTQADFQVEISKPEASTPATPQADALAWTPYLFAAMGGGGALLIISNAGLVCCLVRRHRMRKKEGDAVKKDDSIPKGALNEYGDGELINTQAKKTLLIDSGSETGSSVYQDSTSESGLYYYPTRDYQPSLSPHYESAERGDPRLQDWTEAGYEDWYGDSDVHEYEEVQGVYPPSSRSRWPPATTQASQRREAPWEGFQGAVGVYDEPDLTSPATYEALYGGQGHLV